MNNTQNTVREIRLLAQDTTSLTHQSAIIAYNMASFAADVLENRRPVSDTKNKDAARYLLAASLFYTQPRMRELALELWPEVLKYPYQGTEQ